LARLIVDSEKREAYLKRLIDVGINVKELMDIGRLEVDSIGVGLLLPDSLSRRCVNDGQLARL
jgi:hypothetical protein